MCVCVTFIFIVQCFITIMYAIKNLIGVSSGAGAQSVTVKSTGCGFDPYSKK